MEVPALLDRLRFVVLFGWTVAAIRLLLDFTAPDAWITMRFGVFYTVPLVLIWIGVTRRWGLIGWRAMAVTMFWVAVLVWGLPNWIAYTTGQFMGWEHGRFTPNERAAPVHDEALLKLWAGLLHGILSSLVGFVICLGLGSLFVWVPQRTRRSG